MLTEPARLQAPASAPLPVAIREIPRTLGALLILSADLQDSGDLEKSIEILQNGLDLSGTVQTPSSSIPPHA